MSKKKAAVKKKTAKKPAKKTAKKAVPKASTAAAPTRRTAAATIFVYDVNGQTRVRTSPQLITAGPGFIEWTVVNLGNGDNDVPVEITWPNGGPWGGQPIPIKGNARLSLAGARDGRFKYNVTVNGYTEDPEVEIPEV
jgi:hypothetical protein